MSCIKIVAAPPLHGGIASRIVVAMTGEAELHRK